jgi:hypothetical protein
MSSVEHISGSMVIGGGGNEGGGGGGTDSRRGPDVGDDRAAVGAMGGGIEVRACGGCDVEDERAALAESTEEWPVRTGTAAVEADEKVGIGDTLDAGAELRSRNETVCVDPGVKIVALRREVGVRCSGAANGDGVDATAAAPVDDGEAAEKDGDAAAMVRWGTGD